MPVLKWTNAPGPAPDSGSLEASRKRLEHRIGLNVPHEWWPGPAMLKGIEAAGFRWVQLSTPPVHMLADPRHGVRHASAVRRSLEVTELCAVVRGPADLRLGDPVHDRAFEALLEYALHVGARHVVYRALDYSRRGLETAREEEALRRFGGMAEAMKLTICLENLCPVYPAPSTVCHDPLSVRGLVHRVGSPAVGMLFDIGHANVVASFMGVELLTLIEPVLDGIQLFQVHDNLGARLGGGGSPSVDPLQLDLHLPPGSGTVPWDRIRRMLLAHEAPLLMEINPAHRPSAATLWELGVSVLGGREAPGTLANGADEAAVPLRDTPHLRRVAR